jgi:hypothetical protein
MVAARALSTGEHTGADGASGRDGRDGRVGADGRSGIPVCE